jgi:putative flavoprotein involved in K+ transport
MHATLPESVNTLIVGAGQTGLVLSGMLARGGHEHVLVEARQQLGGSWQDRWDSFTLVTPNWISSLPGFPYDGSDPDGFMGRDEIATRVARYADVIAAPVVAGTTVERVVPLNGDRFAVHTSGGPVQARQVVVATGSYHAPRIPDVAARLSPRVLQLHSHDYRSERQLPSGGVLVVGSAQTGVQLAEELHAARRAVYLAVGRAGRVPRRYRGTDIFGWLAQIGMRGAEVGLGLPTVDDLPDPRLKFAAHPHVSGHGGGHDTNLRQFAIDGIRLGGRVADIDGERVTFAPDLPAQLAFADASFDAQLRPLIDEFITRANVDAPGDDRAELTYEPDPVLELDLADAGVTSVVWATGYALDYSWIDAPIFGERGYPRQVRGVTDVPGLYFLGLLWQSTQASATLVGPMLDGPAIAEALIGADGRRRLGGAVGAKTVRR